MDQRRVTDHEAAVELVRVALLDARESARRHRLLTSGTAATDDGDFVAHMQAVAAAIVDLPALIADPSGRFTGYSMGE